MYQDNLKTKEALDKRGENKSWLIYGEWLPPTCCNVFINCLLLILTLFSINWQRSGSMQYWKPESIREQFTDDFNKI